MTTTTNLTFIVIVLVATILITGNTLVYASHSHPSGSSSGITLSDNTSLPHIRSPVSSTNSDSSTNPSSSTSADTSTPNTPNTSSTSTKSCPDGFTLQPNGTCINSTVTNPTTLPSISTPPGSIVTCSDGSTATSLAGCPSSSTSSPSASTTSSSIGGSISGSSVSSHKFKATNMQTIADIKNCINQSNTNIVMADITEMAKHLANVSAPMQGPFTGNHTELQALNKGAFDCLTNATKSNSTSSISKITLAKNQPKTLISGIPITSTNSTSATSKSHGTTTTALDKNFAICYTTVIQVMAQSNPMLKTAMPPCE